MQGRAGVLTSLAIGLCLAISCCESLAAQASSAEPSHLRSAESLVRQGRLAQAKAELNAELARNHSSIEAYNLLGIIEAQEQDYDGALAHFQKALKIAPDSAKTHNNLGDLYLAEKKRELAEKEFRTSIALDPQNRDGNYNLGVLLLGRGMPAEAIRYLTRVHPADRETRLGLIEANLQTHHTAPALRMASALSAEYPADFNLHFSLGVLLGTAHQYSLSELEFEKADALQPRRFEVLYDLGQACLLHGDYSKAELQLNRALALKPNSAQALYLLGQAEWKQARPLDALEVLVRARDADPGNTDIILLMAQISMAQGYYADAIPLLESGLQIAPQRTDLRLALGESYFRADQINRAVGEFQKAIAAEPSARAYAFLGLSETYLGRFDAAKQDFEKGLALEPRNGFCLFNLGYIAERQGHAAAAAATFEKVLAADPDFSEALLELATLRMQASRYADAEQLLTRYVRLNPSAASGYYKLASVEKKLNKPGEAERDLAQFQELSGRAAPARYRYEHLFDYLDSRSKLAPQVRQQQDLTELQNEAKKRPDEPEVLYLLAEAFLRAGDAGEARSTIAHLDAVKAGDYRTLAGAGVLFARYRLYDDAIQQFESALQANPHADEARFDLANTLFRKGLYAQALDAAQQVSVDGRKDDAYLSLLADIYGHMGDLERAEELERSSIAQSPDNDQNYLSLSLLQLRRQDVDAARKTLLAAQSRVPASGKILWGLGLAAVMEGKNAEAERDFEKAVDLLPEWPGSYSMLGVFYFQTGQITKAREVLDRFRNSHAAGGIDVARIEQVLAAAPQPASAGDSPIPIEKRQQLLQMALQLVDRTL